MAGVNNPPNLKPLIDNQSAEQALDFSWLKSIAAGNKLKLEKANADLAAVFESVNSSSAATQTAVAQSAIDSESATNAARDLVVGQVAQLELKVEKLETELQLFKDGADFDLYTPTSNLNVSVTGSLPVISFAVVTAEIETVYFRNGKGAIVNLISHDKHDLQILVDGVLVFEKSENSNNTARQVIGYGSSIPYMKYRENIEIRFRKSSGGHLSLIDLKVT